MPSGIRSPESESEPQPKEKILGRAREALDKLEKLSDTDSKIEQTMKETHLLIQDCKPYEEYFAYSDRYMKIVKRHDEYLENLTTSSDVIPSTEVSIEDIEANKSAETSNVTENPEEINDIE